MIDLEKLFKAGVHFGHLKKSWCPKMEPYIWGYKNNVHLIDISKTALQIEKAAQFLKDIVAKGHEVLWVGTKKPAQAVIRQVATTLSQPYVAHRWIGGTLSNFAQVKKSTRKFLHYKDILEKTDKYPHYTKKEFNTIQKVAGRLEQNVGGIVQLTWPVGALIVVDVIKEASAIREAATMGVPVIAIVDTNAKPDFVDIVIPANDDSPNAIKVIIEYLAEAVAEGQKIAQTLKAEDKIKKAEHKEDVKVGFELPADFEVDLADDETSGNSSKEKGAATKRRPAQRRQNSN